MIGQWRSAQVRLRRHFTKVGSAQAGQTLYIDEVPGTTVSPPLALFLDLAIMITNLWRPSTLLIGYV